LAAPDGSGRLLCFYSEEPDGCVDVCGEDRIFAYAADGRALAGYPVSFSAGFSSGTDRLSARMVGDDLTLVQYEGPAEGEESGPEERWITQVRPNGNVVLGARVSGLEKCCAISPNGVAYGSSIVDEEGLELRTQLLAFDAHGMRAGWPIVVDGNATSFPSFGPNAQVVYASWIDESSRLGRYNPDGSEATASIDLPITLDWSPDGDGPIPPLVDDRGSVWVVADGTILGFDANNGELPGFPYEGETGLLVQGGDCPAQDTGCQTWVEPPLLDPASLIYALENPPTGKGQRLTVVNRDGSVRSGWPKTLQRPGATWDSVTIGDNRRAYAVALEPEPGGLTSGSISMFAPNGTREWFTVLFEP
jgi:hypothetical protein